MLSGYSPLLGDISELAPGFGPPRVFALEGEAKLGNTSASRSGKPTHRTSKLPQHHEDLHAQRPRTRRESGYTV